MGPRAPTSGGRGGAPNHALVSVVSSLEPGRALDLGCGDGVNAVWLACSGWTVTAVDFSEVALRRGRERAARAGVEVGWVVADLLDNEPAAQAYDLVALLLSTFRPTNGDTSWSRLRRRSRRAAGCSWSAMTGRT